MPFYLTKSLVGGAHHAPKRKLASQKGRTVKKMHFFTMGFDADLKSVEGEEHYALLHLSIPSGKRHEKKIFEFYF